uniref:Uncharacterized protein n=1 Tax=Avena sativa TaxID=4498 RepID=A0ACD5ZNS3_AVESA
MSIIVGGAIEPLLRCLSSAIHDEAQLLGGVHRDAQFIQDELESMNGFLHHLAEASTDHDYQVRPWRKQVRDLAIDTQYCIDLYAHRVGRAPRARGVWGHMHRAIFFLQTIPEHHQVATQIQELKTRARDISERRQRYGTQFPPKSTNEIGGGSGSGGGIGGNALLLHNAYRRGLVDVEPLKDDTLLLIHWLWKETLLHAEEPEAGPGQPIAVIAVVAPDKADDGDLAKEVYNHSSLARLFDCKAFVTIQRPLFLPQVLDDMIQQLRIPHEAESDGEQQLREELKRQVKGRRFFVVVENADHPYPWNEMKDILASSGCSPGSVIMVTTKDSVLAQHFSPDRTMTHSFVQVCSGKANRLVSIEWDGEKRAIMHHVLQKCHPDLFCMRLFLGALYINPYISKNQLVDLCTSLDSSSAWPDAGTATSTCIRMKMMRFCYDMLPKMIRTCLLYLSIFPPNFCVRRTSLVRRWVAEGPVIQGDGPELALDTAERCFDDLVALGFVAIAEAGNLDNVISCKVHRFVHDFITKVVKEESLGDERLPASLAGHLSVSSYVQMRLEQQQGDTNDITTFIDALLLKSSTISMSAFGSAMRSEMALVISGTRSTMTPFTPIRCCMYTASGTLLHICTRTEGALLALGF